MIIVFAVTLAGCGQKASAPSFPSKQIEIIVPYSAGGGTDQVARALANSAKDKLGKPVVVVNKTGGGGAVGMTAGAQAKNDGYTVTMITVELVTLPHLGLAKISNNDFEPVLRVNMDPSAVTVRADAPWKTLKEFIDYAKKNPKKIRVGNSGPGAIWHLAAASLEQKAGIELIHVPFNGAAPAITALLGGNIEAVTVSPAEVSAQVAAGKLKVLGVMSDQRVKTMPNVQTLKEQGVDITIGTWRGLAVPKGTSPKVVKTLHDAFKKAMAEKAFTNFMNKTGLGIGYMSSEAYKANLKVESDNFGILINKLGLKKK